MHTGPLTEIITAVFEFVGIFISLKEYKLSNLIKRFSYIEQLIGKIKSDEISEVVYMFQYGNFKY